MQLNESGMASEVDLLGCGVKAAKTFVLRTVTNKDAWNTARSELMGCKRPDKRINSTPKRMKVRVIRMTAMDQKVGRHIVKNRRRETVDV
jgi:hypothetical protein